jgi:DUF4097 and DUF4098 domain-containing protein YvlB
MNRARITTCILMTLAVVAGTACSALGDDRYEQTVRTKVDASPALLHVEDAVGEVTVLAWNRPYVQIDALKKGPNADAVRALTISVRPSGSRLDVVAEFGDNNNHRSVDFTIHLPASASVTVDSNVGKVDVAGFTRDVDVSADVGKVTVSMAQLGKGQHVDLKSSVGKIELTIPRASDAAITASTSVGDIGGSVPFSLDRHTVGADGTATLGSGAATVHLTASTGSITVNRE